MMVLLLQSVTLLQSVWWDVKGRKWKRWSSSSEMELQSNYQDFSKFLLMRNAVSISAVSNRRVWFCFVLFIIIFNRKCEMTLLISAWIQMIPAHPVREPSSVHGSQHSGLSWSSCSHSGHHFDPSEPGIFDHVVKPTLLTSVPKWEWVIGWVYLGAELGLFHRGFIDLKQVQIWVIMQKRFLFAVLQSAKVPTVLQIKL